MGKVMEKIRLEHLKVYKENKASEPVLPFLTS
jgi:hypothetical protein